MSNEAKIYNDPFGQREWTKEEKKKRESRYKGPVNLRDYEDLDDEVERTAFKMEASESAQAFARQMGKKYSFMKYVAIELFELAENALKNRS